MITKAQVQEQLDIIARTKGHRVNPETDYGCVYTGRNGNHCLAGEVLVNLGQPVPDYGSPNNASTIVARLVEINDIDIESEALELLSVAQEAADHSLPWGKVIEHLPEAMTMVGSQRWEFLRSLSYDDD